MAVAALYEGDWYRAQILSLQPAKVTVLYIDYGNAATVDGQDIRVLPKEYQQLPAQAIRFSIYGIRVEENQWSKQVLVTSLSPMESVLLCLI